jgi:hypothetical protein
MKNKLPLRAKPKKKKEKKKKAEKNKPGSSTPARKRLYPKTRLAKPSKKPRPSADDDHVIATPARLIMKGEDKCYILEKKGPGPCKGKLTEYNETFVLGIPLKDHVDFAKHMTTVVQRINKKTLKTVGEAKETLKTLIEEEIAG